MATREWKVHSLKKKEMCGADNNAWLHVQCACAIYTCSSRSFVTHHSLLLLLLFEHCHATLYELFCKKKIRNNSKILSLRVVPAQFNVILCRRLDTRKSDSPSYFIMFEPVVCVECISDKWMRDSCTSYASIRYSSILKARDRRRMPLLLFFYTHFSSFFLFFFLFFGLH